MTEPNFWIDNAGSIISAGAALIGVIGAGLITNLIQFNIRKSEEVRADRDRQIEAAAAALTACREWESVASRMLHEPTAPEQEISELRTREVGIFRALNYFAFLTGNVDLNQAAQETLSAQNSFRVTMDPDDIETPNKAINTGEKKALLSAAREARQELESLSRKQFFGQEKKRKTND